MFLGGNDSKYLAPMRPFSRTTPFLAFSKKDQIILVEMDKYKGVIIKKNMDILVDLEKEFDTQLSNSFDLWKS